MSSIDPNHEYKEPEFCSKSIRTVDTGGSPRSETDHLSYQIGGTHYRDMPIQPSEFVERLELGFMLGNVVKYVCRYKDKGGIMDLQKALHYLQMKIQLLEEG